MSVFTPVSRDELAAWLQPRQVGTLLDLQGISTGIENSNFFVTTTRGRYVLTLFEKLPASALPYYLDLLCHLAGRGILCPKPIADRDGALLGTLNGKPACLATCLQGASLTEPTPMHCAQVGKTLAVMHLGGASYPARMPNPRGPDWWDAAAAQVSPKMAADEAAQLDAELAFQAAQRFDRLPQGVIHADLFRDNVLFQDGCLSGVLDFYYACDGAWAYDLAIAANDWCVTPAGGLDPLRLTALLDAYRQVRPLTRGERDAWPALLRAGALRFWLSRLYDGFFPRPGELTYAKDPDHFRRILRAHVANPLQLPI